MTLPSHAPPLAFADLQEAFAALRAAGLRLSAARRLVLEGLFATPEPVTAEQLANGLDGAIPRSDLASVYRNLEALERIGLVRHVHLGHGGGMYALAGRGAREYLVCERCGSVRSVEPGQLEGARAAIRRAFGFDARFTHFPISGLCAGCAAGPAPE